MGETLPIFQHELTPDGEQLLSVLGRAVRKVGAKSLADPGLPPQVIDLVRESYGLAQPADVVARLMDMGLGLNSPYNPGAREVMVSPTSDAIAMGKASIAKEMIAAGGGPNKIDPRGCTGYLRFLGRVFKDDSPTPPRLRLRAILELDGLDPSVRGDRVPPAWWIALSRGGFNGMKTLLELDDGGRFEGDLDGRQVHHVVTDHFIGRFFLSSTARVLGRAPSKGAAGTESLNSADRSLSEALQWLSEEAGIDISGADKRSGKTLLERLSAVGLGAGSHSYAVAESESLRHAKKPRCHHKAERPGFEI